MAKHKRHFISEEQTRKMYRKVSRDEELDGGNGWTATHKVHKSSKAYSRKGKHREEY